MALKERDSLSVWISKDIEDTWYEQKPKDRKRSRQIRYSNKAIEMLFKLPLRQIEGFARSLFEFGRLNLQVPEFSRLSERSRIALSTIKLPTLKEASCLIIDSTGLKVYGESEWLENKHRKQYKRKVWRKLHVAINSEGIIVSKIITNHLTDDRQCVEPLIDQTNDGLITEVIADRGYDSGGIYELLEGRGIKTGAVANRKIR